MRPCANAVGKQTGRDEERANFVRDDVGFVSEDTMSDSRYVHNVRVGDLRGDRFDDGTRNDGVLVTSDQQHGGRARQPTRRARPK
jgi:hypothetical protein